MHVQDIPRFQSCTKDPPLPGLCYDTFLYERVDHHKCMSSSSTLQIDLISAGYSLAAQQTTRRFPHSLHVINARAIAKLNIKRERGLKDIVFYGNMNTPSVKAVMNGFWN